MLDGVLTKMCRDCFDILPLDGFHKSKGGKLGRASICKVCSKFKTYAYRAAHPEAHRRASQQYRKTNPEAVVVSLKAWLAKHPTYERDRGRRRYAADPARSREATAAWMAANPAKVRSYHAARSAAMRAAGEVDRDYVQFLLCGQCAYCPADATEIDHVVPVTRGGTNARENLVGSCRKCNASKGARTPAEWYAARGEVCGGESI